MSMTVPGVIPDTMELARQSTDLLTQAREFTIDNPQAAQDAGQLLRIVKGLKDEVTETFDPIVEQTHKAWKSALGARAKHMEPICAADVELRNKMAKYQHKLDADRQAEIRRKQEEAEAVERERRERERAAQMEQIEAQRKAAAAAKKAGDEQRAAEMREQANKQAAAAREAAAAPIIVAPVVAPPPVAKVEGVSVRMVPDFRIVDASKIPSKFMLPNEKAIRAVVNALGEQAAIPGVEVFLKPITTVRN